jgi:hypothetical protein
MKFSITTLTCVLVMALSVIARADIYESKDAEGNPVFTDTPTTGVVEKIDLPQENIADSVKVPPEAEAAKTSVSRSTKETTGHGNVIVIPDSRNERLERELAADRPHEVLEAEKRYEVGDNPTAEEMERREAAKEGEYIDEEGNTVRVEHRGHAR